MSFLDTCIQDSLPIWRSCMETPFLRGVADGTLDEECFKGYIVDDSLYLREYSKVFAWGILHSSDMEEIRNYYTLLAFVNEAEDSTRRYYLKRYGLKDEEIQPLPLRPENRAYVDYMLNAAQNAVDAADCMMACLPALYAQLRLDLRKDAEKRSRRAEHPVRPVCQRLRRGAVREHLQGLGGLYGKGLRQHPAGAGGPLPGNFPHLLGA